MTFDPFGDFETRGYLRNVFGEKDPDIIKRQEHHSFRLHVAEVLEALRARPSLGYGDILDAHRRLFIDYYPWAGQDRLAILPNLAVGKAGRYDIFAHPQDIRRAVEHALGLGLNSIAMKARPGEVMGLLAYAHPFLDGNGRTLMVVHADLACCADIHVEWEHVHKLPYLTALTHELEHPGKALDQFLAPFVRPGAISLTDTADRLSRNPGLGPTADVAPGAQRSVVASPAPLPRPDAAIHDDE
jgi:cell filamentation protein